MELARLGIDAGEPILICLESFQGRGDKYAASARWRVYRAPQRMGQQKDGTFIVPAIPGSLAIRGEEADDETIRVFGGGVLIGHVASGGAE